MTLQTPASQVDPAQRSCASAASAHPSTAHTDNTPRVVDSDEVLQGRTAVVIAHRGVYYRLQATRQGKLILTK